MKLFIKLFIPILFLSGCAYFNTYYNAELYFDEAQKLSKENKTGEVSREERQLYDKAIQKTRKLMQKYPTSSYVDDAHLLMCKSYYYRDDFGIALKQLNAFKRDHSDSELISEIPLWVARCLVAKQDLEMAKHEVAKLTADKTPRKLKADAYLLLGEIALDQDSIALALEYLDNVVKVAPNSDIRGKAALQRGDLYLSQNDYNKALESYANVIDKRTNTALKVQAVLKKFEVMLALNMEDEVLNDIAKMLKDDDYFEIRGRLDLELAKVYLHQNELLKAETKLEEITKNYSNQPSSAEAAYNLGLMYMREYRKYKEAKAHFGNVVRFYSRSDLKKDANDQKKRIEKLESYIFDYNNLRLALQGKPPVKKEKKSNRRGSARGRSKGRAPGNAKHSPKKENEPVEIVEVSHEDSIRIEKEMWENKYIQAEHLLFKMEDPEGAIMTLTELELTNRDTSLMQNSLYMKYYIYEERLHNPQMSKAIVQEIKGRFPDYYELVFGEKKAVVEEVETQASIIMEEAAQAFDSGRWDESVQILKSVYSDTTNSLEDRALAAFKVAWLDDMYALNQDESVEYYNLALDIVTDDDIKQLARDRMRMIRKNELAVKDSDEMESEEKEPEKDEQNEQKQ